MSNWTLYIDETGKLEDPGACVAVGGLLVDHSVWDPDRFCERLRKGLQDAAPYVTWPLHSAHVNVPVFHVLSRFNTGDQRREILAAIAELEAAHPMLVGPALERLREGRRPKIEGCLDTLDAAYKAQDQDGWLRAQDEAHRTRAQVGRVLAKVAQDAMMQCFVAGETSLMDACGKGILAGSPADDRYAGLLQCVLRRAVHFLERKPGTHQLTVSVLSRDVVYPALGVSGPMAASVVGDIIRGLAPLFLRGAGLRVHPGNVAQYRGDVHPMLVLTDFVANWGRRQLSRPNMPLANVERQFEARLRTPVRGAVDGPTGPIMLSSLAATGVSEDWVCWAVEHARTPPQPPRPASPPGRRWAVEQSEEWAHAF